jgi:lipopolysaccharide transport system ATP-binding protein
LSKYAIHAEGLSKEYAIGAPQERYHTLRDALVRGVTGPFERFRSMCGRPTREMIWALKDVSFRIDQGEVVGVIGRNGAGKSTLLKILSRITVPTEGQVAVRGRVVSLLEVGTGFHPELTGRENIFLNGAILGMTRNEVRRKFEEIVDFADVERFIDTPVKHYSSGMYMRLAFAIAAHLETDILLVDEVLAVGDASFQQKCLAKIQDVAGYGRTVLFVSHNMTAVQALCERVIHIGRGRIIGDGQPKTEIRKYLSSTTPNRAQEKRVAIGETLTIVNISILPNPVESGDNLHFDITLLANSRVLLSEVALLLHALQGPRVGIIDLRNAGLPVTIEPGICLRIKGRVQSMPLVENYYCVGLYINSGTFVGDVLDLDRLTVLPACANGSYAQYPAEARGWVEFQSECSCQLLESIISL